MPSVPCIAEHSIAKSPWQLSRFENHHLGSFLSGIFNTHLQHWVALLRVTVTFTISSRWLFLPSIQPKERLLTKPII